MKINPDDAKRTADRYIAELEKAIECLNTQLASARQTMRYGWAREDNLEALLGEARERIMELENKGREE